MRILIVADFQEDHVRFLVNNARIFSKGFTRNGHDVLQFSYEQTLLRHNFIPKKRWLTRAAKRKTDNLLVKLAQHHQSELVFITAFKKLDGQTIAQLKQALPNATFVAWYGDLTAELKPAVAQIAQQCHWFLATSAGATLQRYKQAGARHCAFLPNPCDPDIEHPHDVEPKFRSDILFTGKLAHKLPGQDPLRNEIITELHDQGRLTVYGDLGHPPIYGLDYLHAIAGTKIALSINAFNDVPLYHSDRLTHYLACGAFVLARRVPQTDRLFQHAEHLYYFDTPQECRRLIDRFLADHDQRQRIAQAGMTHVHKNFNGQTLAKHVINLAATGQCDAPWATVI